MLKLRRVETGSQVGRDVDHNPENADWGELTDRTWIAVGWINQQIHIGRPRAAWPPKYSISAPGARVSDDVRREGESPAAHTLLK